MTAEFVHRFIPAGNSALTLLLLHGTGGDEDDLVPIGRALAPGAALLSPRGKVLENGMPRFFRRLAEGVFDIEDVRLRAAELAEFVSESAARYGFDAKRVFALGYSNGANMAAAIMLLHPGILAGGVLMRAMLPLTPEVTPDLSGTDVLLIAGQHDPFAPTRSTQELASLLSRAGATVEARWHAAGHELGPEDFQAGKEWLKRYANAGQ